MKPKLIAIYLSIILLPLGLLAWLGTELARDEQTRLQSRFRELLADQLAARNETIDNLIAQLERELLALSSIPDNMDANSLRARVREERLVRQIFILKPDGSFQFPLLDGSATEQEKGFFERTRSVWESGVRFSTADDLHSSPNAATSSRYRSSKFTAGVASHGWHTWFWGNGVHLLFWRQRPSGYVVGAEVDRVALTADLVAQLPETGLAEEAKLAGRVVLADAHNSAIYQWGVFEPEEGAEPDAWIPVSDPLSMWTLSYFAAPETLLAGTGRSAWFTVATTSALGCLLMVGLAVYFFRESTREIRDASQRVSFVNQVSHELKTPLTNIRMYAELLQAQMEESEEGARENLRVIISESQRLSRMIGNVLTFARRQRDSLHPSERVCAPDETIGAVIDHFRPALESKNVAIHFEGQARRPVKLDTDFLEQILGNLFGNVEKYAAEGGEMNVRSAQNGNLLTVEVADGGPGIPTPLHEEVFQPFKRLSNKLSDGVTGTGIGLAIARDLARVHGGDVAVQPSERGAVFKVTMKVGVSPLNSDEPR